MYTALVLDEPSRKKLIEESHSTSGWEWHGHHMTINLGSAKDGPAANLLGQSFGMIVNTWARDEKVLAVGVWTDCPSVNPIKHITLEVNRGAGGKPKDSNGLGEWKAYYGIVLMGTVEEIGEKE